jgi:RNA polymerase sigma-70 factor (ECF subfamily)
MARRADPAPHDFHLIEELSSGRTSALETLYRAHGGAVIGVAERLLRNRDLAEDVAQEVFLRLWRRPERYDPERGPLRSFLLRDAHGRSIDLIRAEEARKRREEQDGKASSEAVPGPEQEVWEQVRSDEVRRAIGGLPEHERAAIQLAFYGGLSYREVAYRLGEPEGTIKSRIRSGLQRLHGPLLQAGLSGT